MKLSFTCDKALSFDIWEVNIQWVHNFRKDYGNITYAYNVWIETVSPEGTFCDTVQVPSSAADMELS